MALYVTSKQSGSVVDTVESVNCNNQDEEQMRTGSDKSLINIPKQWCAHSNDLKKINFCGTPSTTEKNNTDEAQTPISCSKKLVVNDCPKLEENERVIVNSSINSESRFSGQKWSSKNKEEDICQTLHEKNIFEEIFKADAEKRIDTME